MRRWQQNESEACGLRTTSKCEVGGAKGDLAKLCEEWEAGPGWYMAGHPWYLRPYSFLALYCVTSLQGMKEKWRDSKGLLQLECAFP